MLVRIYGLGFLSAGDLVETVHIHGYTTPNCLKDTVLGLLRDGCNSVRPLPAALKS